MMIKVLKVSKSLDMQLRWWMDKIELIRFFKLMVILDIFQKETLGVTG